ncbi:MAG: hypothetical protein H7101_11910 [Deinococcales bacterium]|nr:hypothetical protein [Chitinophagaceae bacterium]
MKTALRVPFTIALMAIAFLFTRCNKEHLPEFYYQCNVDGQVYKPNNCANCLTCTIYRDTIFLLGANRGFEALGMGLHDINGVRAKSYVLNGQITGSADYKFSTTVNDIFRTDSSRTGVLKIEEIDSQNKIITGTFSFTAFNIVQNKIVTVTEGKFRLHYNTN